MQIYFKYTNFAKMYFIYFDIYVTHFSMRFALIVCDKIRDVSFKHFDGDVMISPVSENTSVYSLKVCIYVRTF